MMTYIKANMAAIAASLLDFALVFVLVQWARMNVSAATAVGMVCGGALAFVLGRGWAFEATSGAAGGQVFRYALVWVGNIVFSTILVGWVAGWHGVHFMVARVGVSVVMGLTYSYFLQRLFVFPKTPIAAQNGAPRAAERHGRRPD